MTRTNDKPERGFSFSRAKFEELVDAALAHAKKLGATDAGAEASEGCGLSVSVRKGELENVERNRDKSLGITVYIGKKRGNAATSDFSKAAIQQTVKAAYDIARFTAEDETSGLPDERDIARVHKELDLFHPWSIDSEEAARLALLCAEKKWLCCAETPAPSLFVMRLSVAKAAASHSSAMRAASSLVMSQGWKRSRSGCSDVGATSSSSGKPEVSSSAVKRAMS